MDGGLNLPLYLPLEVASLEHITVGGNDLITQTMYFMDCLY